VYETEVAELYFKLVDTLNSIEEYQKDQKAKIQ